MFPLTEEEEEEEDANKLNGTGTGTGIVLASGSMFGWEYIQTTRPT
jgi:predicted negative regulator of RcsB-dependent stress response